MSDRHSLPVLSPTDEARPPAVPESVVLAGELPGLDSFLEDAAPGFHWELLEELVDGIYILDRDQRIRYWSGGAARITGYTAKEVLGRTCSENILVHVDLQGRHLCRSGCPLKALLHDGQRQEMDVFLHHRDGHRVPVHVRGWPIRDVAGQIIGAVEAFTDMTARAGDLERIRQLQKAAFYDALTGIANRRYADNAIAGRLAEFQREGFSFGVILCDVDHFKQFNDRYGHETGDEVLKVVAQTLTHACRPYDVAARWGGEEFVVVAGSDATGVSRLAERLRALVAASEMEHCGNQVRVTVSVGATMVRAGDDAASLLARADRFLYTSKAAGRDCVTYEP